MKGKFVAFDLLRANSSYTSVRKIALSVFENGEITEQRHWKIKPEPFETHYPFNTNLEDYQDAPHFNEVWSEIAPYLTEGPLVIFQHPKYHITPLLRCVEFYHLTFSLPDVVCIADVFAKSFPGESFINLDYLTYKFNISDDASGLQGFVNKKGKLFVEVCNEAGLTLDQVVSDFGFIYIPTTKKDPSFSKGPKKNVPLVEPDPEHEFYGKNVCFSGNFEGLLKEDAMQMVNSIGGTGTNSLTGKTDFLIVGHQSGRDKSRKMIQADEMRAKGHRISVMDQNSFFEMFI